MKTLYLCLQYNDGIKQFIMKDIDENYPQADYLNMLNESFSGVRNVITYNSKQEWEAAKNFNYI